MSSGDPETRKKVMEATRELVEESHGKAVRLEDIAKRAGVSRQAIYLHFGSRVGLMVATVQYVDEAAGFLERTKFVREAENSLIALDRFVAFWADYWPGISDLARMLVVMRNTDSAAAAAWADRMEALWNICHSLAKWIKRDGKLDPIWTTKTAADLLWMLILQAGDSLCVERGWSKEDYVERLQYTLRRALTTSGT